MLINEPEPLVYYNPTAVAKLSVVGSNPCGEIELDLYDQIWNKNTTTTDYTQGPAPTVVRTTYQKMDYAIHSPGKSHIDVMTMYMRLDWFSDTEGKWIAVKKYDTDAVGYDSILLGTFTREVVGYPVIFFDTQFGEKFELNPSGIKLSNEVEFQLALHLI